MSILLVAQHRDMEPFKKAINDKDPNIDVEIWPDVENADRVQFAVAWNHPKNVFKRFPNLKVISSLGAGIDHLTYDESIPKKLKITRVVIPSLSEQMSDFLLTSVLNIVRRTEFYLQQQQQAVWSDKKPMVKDEVTAGIMGLGELGRTAAIRLHQNGFKVGGWSASKKNLDGIDTFTSSELDHFLKQTNILINLLPLTPETEGILDLNLIKKLKKPSFIINAARGEHLVEEDLIYALDTELIEHAILDVFRDEPLPESHPFLGRKKLTITPHIASITDPTEVADLLIDNYKRILSGLELRYEINREKGY
jgi:glyoxylate/hydroxypyruvate reductase